MLVRTRRFYEAPAAGVLLLAASSCGPLHEGPQLTSIPKGLGLYASYQAARHPLPKHPVVRQLAYAPPAVSGTQRDSIVITEYAGVASRTDVRDAHEAYAGRYRSTTYGPIQDTEIDGRPAFYYTEATMYRDRLSTLAVNAIVPYPERTQTYGVVFSAGSPDLQSETYLLEVVRSFRVIKPGSTQGKAFVISGILVGILTLVAWRLHVAGVLPL